MNGRSIMIFIIVGILGVISTGIGLVFEFSPDKTLVHLFYFSWSYDDYCTGTNCVQCEYFRSAAFFLVIAAVISVILAQMVVSISTDCGCCSGRRRSSSALPTLAVLTFFLSWLASIAAIIVYIIGGAKQYGVQFPEFGHFFSSLRSIWAENEQCYKVKHGIFGAASAFSFGAVTLGIITYLTILFGDSNKRTVRGVTLNNNQGNAPSPMDEPVVIALPDVPTAADRRCQRTTVQWPMPVMEEA